MEFYARNEAKDIKNILQRSTTQNTLQNVTSKQQKMETPKLKWNDQIVNQA